LAADVLLEEHVVGQHHRRAAAGLQVPVDVLEERELLVLVWNVKSSRVGRPPPFFVPKGGFVRITSALGTVLADGESVSPSTNLALDAVEEQRS
jgi:hypothetical protein